MIICAHKREHRTLLWFGAPNVLTLDAPKQNVQAFSVGGTKMSERVISPKCDMYRIIL